MPTAPCRRCNASVEIADGSQIDRVYCPTCRELFARYFDFDKPSVDEPPLDAEGRRRVRRRRRHIIAEEREERDRNAIGPPEGRGLGFAAQVMIGCVGAGELAAFFVLVGLLAGDIPNGTMRTIFVLGGVETFAFLVTAIVFLSWLQKARRNVEHLRGRELTWSSEMAIGGFLLPLVNLVIPYSVVKEIWNASAPARPDEWGLEPPRPSADGLLIAWWISWAAAFFSKVLFEQSVWGLGRPIFAADWIPSVLVGLTFVHLLFAVDSVLAILVIRTMMRRQEERWQALIAAETTADA
jgi:hypothetical protein